VVVFYQGRGAPTATLRYVPTKPNWRPALDDLGFAMIAVSPQKPDGSLTAAETNQLTYTVVSDPGNQIASALGHLTEPSATAVAAQKKLGIDLAEHNADGGLTLPMPTTVIVDATGVIRWIDVHPNYTAAARCPTSWPRWTRSADIHRPPRIRLSHTRNWQWEELSEPRTPYGRRRLRIRLSQR
jgi:peroxiredoxin